MLTVRGGGRKRRRGGRRRRSERVGLGRTKSTVKRKKIRKKKRKERNGLDVENKKEIKGEKEGGKEE